MTAAGRPSSGRRAREPESPRGTPGTISTLAGLTAVAAALRIPTFAASNHLTFDDGVFGASAVAMRDGGVPFRDVFSSQGPLFLPLVWMFDLVGFRTENAPRLLALASGIAVTLLLYVIGRRLHGHGVGLLAAALGTVSGSLLWTTGPLAADGPGLALALGAVAVALWYRDRPAVGKVLAFGVLAGAAFAVKSLFAVPPAMVVAWVLLERRAWRDLAVGVTASVVFVLAVSVPWGVADVWDQAVVYHLEAAGDRTPGANAEKVVSTLWDRDLLVFAFAVAGAGLAVAGRVRTPSTGTPPPQRVSSPQERANAYPWGGPATPLAPWAVALLAVFLLEHPLWRPHLTHAVPVLALTAAYAFRHRLRWAVALLLVALVPHVVTTSDILWPDDYGAAEAQAVASLERLPEHAFAISDEPGFVWRAGLRTPADLVDASILRIESERITADSLTRAAHEPRVCAVLVWSQRFQRFDLGARLAGYRLAQEYGNGRRLYTRDCPGAT